MLSSFAAAIAAAGIAPPDWVVEQSGEAGGWILVTPENESLPAQGWKLHLSATVHTADALLARALPVLVAERAAFKIAQTANVLVSLNEGSEGLSQVGKFVTVYPPDEVAAVRLARELDAATSGLAGPAVPSDRRLGRSSAVHYRYGGFDGRVVQLPYGEVVPAIAGPEGELVPDRRAAQYAAPSWVDDPFVRAGLVGAADEPELVLADRYVLGALLHHTPRGKIFLALDVDAGRRVVVKQASRGAAVAADGRDARDQLRNEHAVLERLRADPRFPEPYGLLMRDEDVFLVMQDVAGRTLGEHVEAVRARGSFVPPEQVRRWAAAVAGAVAAMHERRLVHRDLKPTNVIVAGDGQVLLIDLELAHDLDDPRAALGLGTPGYMSPAQASGARPSVADDVYGLGALTYFLATGADPGQTPRAQPLSDRPPRALNPSLPQGLVSVIERCLAQDSDQRIAGVPELVAELTSPTRHAAAPSTVAEIDVDDLDAAGLVRAVTRSLVTDARPVAEGRGVTWLSRRYGAGGGVARDVNSGTAGVVLALADLVDDDAGLEVLARGAGWLASAPLAGPESAPGLYVGELGIALALSRAGQRLRDEALIAAALARARQAVHAPMVSPDLFNGTAGRLVAHLVLWEAAGADDQLAAARACGDALVQAAEGTEAEASWPIPEGYAGLSGKTHTGYSHGAAGIADALLDLYDATGDERFAAVAGRAATWLARIAVPATEDTAGLEWPVADGGEPVGPFWCHGAGGVARFFLHAARCDLFPGAAAIAEAAAHTVIAGGRACGPTRCHGLAGSIELLLDLQRATGDEAYAVEARRFGRLLLAFVVADNGSVRWASDQPGSIEPGYMVGSAGIALALARLADPGRSHQLSLEGMRMRPAALVGAQHGEAG